MTPESKDRGKDFVAHGMLVVMCLAIVAAIMLVGGKELWRVLGLCVVLWTGVGLALSREAVERGTFTSPSSVLESVRLTILVMLFGPFAQQLFR